MNIQVLQKMSDFKNSKQINDNTMYSVDVVDYDISPKALSTLGANSFLLSGAMSKVINGGNTNLISETATEEILDRFNKIKKTILDYGVKNIFINGNAFFEVIRNNIGEVIDVIPVITDTIRLLPGGEGAVQKIGTEEVFFNIFEYDEQIIKEKIDIWKKTKARKYELVSAIINGRRRTGYNPNLNDVILIKEANIDSIYYGKPKIQSSIDQILLLNYIDQYFVKFFEKGTMKSRVLYDKSGKMTIADKKLIPELFKQKSQGLNNAFNALMVSGDIGEIRLDSDIDAKQFNEVRRELRKDILADLEVPYDILYSDTSNKSTSQVSKELFYNYTIKPFQNIFLDVINNLAKTYNKDYVFEFEKVDVKDIYEETKLLIEMAKTGIITPNEVRSKSVYNFEDIDGGDELLEARQDITPVEKEELLKSLQV